MSTERRGVRGQDPSTARRDHRRFLLDLGPTSLPRVREGLLGHLRSLGCSLIQLFLRDGHDRLDLAAWTGPRLSRGGPRRRADAQDQLRTGPLCRALLMPRHGGGPGVHPLESRLGLTRDAYSPLVIGWFCRLATRVSFRLANNLGGMFLGAAAAGLGDRGMGPGPGRGPPMFTSARARCPRTRASAGHRDRRQGGARPPRGRNRPAAWPAVTTKHDLSASVSGIAAGQSGAVGDAQRGGRRGTRARTAAVPRGGDGHVATGRGRAVARSGEQEGVRDVRFAGSALNWAGARRRVLGSRRGPTRPCRLSSTARRAWSSGCGDSSPAPP